MNTYQRLQNITHPVYTNGQWEKGPYTQGGAPIFNGSFTDTGFVPNHMTPINQQVAGQQSLQFCQDLVTQLQEGFCYTGISSECDLNWQAFLLLHTVENVQQAIKAIFTSPPKAVSQAYQQKQIPLTYHTDIQLFETTERACLFWQNHHSPPTDRTLQAYQQVSKQLNIALTDVHEIRAYSDYIEFPILFAGIHKETQLFCGLITEVVWT